MPDPMHKDKSMQSEYCGAKTRSGATCKNWAMPNGRCRMHGGKSLSGPAAAPYKTGKYSKYLRGDLLAKYEESLSDRRLTLIDDIAVTDARVAELMSSMGGDSLMSTWKRMEKMAKRVGRDYADGDVRELISLVLDGAEDARRWMQVTQLQEHKRKLVESENKASAIAERSMSADEFVYRLRQLAEVIKDVVHDQRVRNNLTAAIERTVLGRTSGRASA